MLLSGVAGTMLVITAMLFHELGLEEAHFLEATFTSIGGLMLIWAHISNYKQCRCPSSRAN